MSDGDALIEFGKSKLDADGIDKGGDYGGDYEAEFGTALYYEALRLYKWDIGRANAAINDLQNGRYGVALQDYYTQKVSAGQSDTKNGWDKVRHFLFTAQLQIQYRGILAPEAFTYGKEIFDELESIFGKDPEGYSIEDIHSDNLGEAFGETIGAYTAFPSGIVFKSILEKASTGEVAYVGSTVICFQHGKQIVVTGGTVGVGPSNSAVARMNDLISCGATIVTASYGIKVDDKPVARVGDIISHGGVILTGYPICLIGD